MTNPSDDRALLISAYLDGELDAAARATVEADEELWAGVEATAALRSVLAQRPAADDARREAVLAAALAAFDQPDLAAISPPVVAASGVDEVERSFASARGGTRWRPRWLAPVAAAAVVVAGLGVLGVVALTDREDDDSTAGAPAVMDESAATAAAAATELMADAAPAADEADTEAAREATTMAAAGEEAGGTERVIASPEDLTAFVADLAGAASTAVSEPLEVCGRDVLGLATYLEASEARAVAVYVDETNDEVVALDTSTCAPVLRAPAP